MEGQDRSGLIDFDVLRTKMPELVRENNRSVVTFRSCGVPLGEQGDILTRVSSCIKIKGTRYTHCATGAGSCVVGTIEASETRAKVRF